MTLRTAILAFAIFLASFSAARAQEPARAVSSYLRAFSEAGPINGVVLVARNGEIVASGAYGKADFTLGVPNRPDTRFQIASITKTFTALLILRLAEEGRMNLSAPIGTYLPNLPADWPGRGATIEQLLEHRSGLRGDIMDFPTSGHDFPPVVTQVNGDFFTLDELVAMIAARPFPAKPSHDFSYSSDGYTLLGAAAAAVTKLPYEQALRRYIFEPAGGLSGTGYAPQTRIVPGLASGYRETWAGFENARRLGISPAGGLHSTASDLFRWSEAIRRGDIMSPAAKARAWAPTARITQYGWKVRTDPAAGRPGSLIVEASGALPGANSLVTLTLQDNITVIVLTNTRQMRFRLDELTNGVIAILRGSPPPPVRRSAAHKLATAIAAQGPGSVADTFGTVAENEAKGLYVDEGEINSLGYHLLGRGNRPGAIAVLRLNTLLFPQSGNAHDSLGEAYAAAGDKANAIAHYERALALDSRNENARTMLDGLRR